MGKVLAAYGGGFKPPTKGHLEVVKQALKQFPEIDELTIYVGGGERNGLTQSESLIIWHIFKKYLPMKVKIEPSKAPIGDVVRLGKNNPQDEVYFVIGGREGRQDDLDDIESRTKNIEKKYPNMKIKVITTPDKGMSGTNARNAAKSSAEEFYPFLPDELNDKEKEEVYNIVRPVINERGKFAPEFDEDEVEDIEDFADERMRPDIDIDLSGKHFFDRLNDPRNYPDIEPYELEDFFEKLADKKDEFIAFLKKYRQMVAKDPESNINIPFMKIADKAIAKTIMRKKNFASSTPILPLQEGRYDQEALTQSRFIMNMFKAELGNKFTGDFEGQLEDVYYDLELIFNPQTFDVLGPTSFIVNAAADGDSMTIQIDYNPDAFPQAYNELNAEVKDALRHELEHVGQFNFNKGVNVDGNDDLPLFDYLTLDYEIPAFVQGLYRKAKTKKISLTQAIQDFLDERTEELSPEEEAKVMQIWTNWAKENLPKAQINEIGEGSSKPFFYHETFRSGFGSNFAYEIDGRVENEDGKTLQLVPIKLQGIGFKTLVDVDDSGDWTIDGYEDIPKGKFLNVNPGTTLKGIEIIFSQIGRENSFAAVNDRVFMFRLMATIKKILNEEFAKNGEPDILIYSPTKEGDEGAEETGRHRLYSAFIKKAFPKARVYVDKKEDEITFKLNEALTIGKKVVKTIRKNNSNNPEDHTIEFEDGTTEPYLKHLSEADPKKGTGKKPKGSGRRLYTDEDPSDTVKIKFSTRQDIVDTLNKTSFKNKSHARQSQVINLIHQRVRAAYNRAKKPEVKKRLKTALDYITKRKEASKAKTKRLQAQKKKKKANENVAPNHNGKAAPYGSGYDEVTEGDTYEKMAAKGKKAGNLKQGTVRKRLNIPKGEKVPMYKINKELARLRKMDKDKDKKGVQLGDKNQKYYKALQLAKTLKSTTNLNENASYSKDIDIMEKLAELTNYMRDKGYKIDPLPSLEFVNGDTENARDFFGKTAYYDPNEQKIVLYTEGRHPKDIARSYAHEMIHHIQNLEGRLGNINTTNTQEDDHLNDIEAEANLKGTMTFRNWTDSLQEKKKVKDPFGLNAYALELARGLEEALNTEEEDVSSKDMDYIIYTDMDGVLSDFDKRFMEFSDGIRPSEYEKNMGREAFWDLIDNKVGVPFWAGMDWMPDGKQYWNYIKKYNPIILSAPSRNNESRYGKRIWKKRNMPDTKMILAYASDKQNYAKSNAILIDDRKKNIDQWKAAGGIGILHISAEDTIRQLKDLGL